MVLKPDLFEKGVIDYTEGEEFLDNVDLLLAAFDLQCLVLPETSWVVGLVIYSHNCM